MEGQVVLGHSSTTGMPAKQDRVPVSLLHLPDELLLKVISELDRRDLYTLSTQCKRLQRVALPLYLRSVGITIPLIFPIDNLHISHREFYTPGIPLAFFSKSIRRFACDIGPASSQARTTLALLRLCRMIINMEALDDLALHFRNWNFTSLFEENITTEACVHLLEVVAKRRSRLELSYDGKRTREWKPHYAELVEKEAVQWRNRPLLKSIFTAVRRYLSLGVSRTQSSHEAATYPHRSSDFKTLIFKSNIFLLPPYSGWVFKTMNTAPLTRLDLIEVELPSPVSSLLFGALTIPTLEHLRIILGRFEFDALPEFLSRHNAISTFEISCWDVHELPKTTLPALVSLASHPSGIGELLTPTGAFPKLAHVRVVVHLPVSNQFAVNYVEGSLAGAAERLSEANIRLCLEILECPPSPMVLLFRSPTPVLERDTSPILGHVIDPVLKHVREVAFGRDVAAPSPGDLPDWLSLFPLLEHIEFLNPRVGVKDQTKISMLRCIVEKCPGIRSVRIGNDTRDVSTWLSSGDH